MQYVPLTLLALVFIVFILFVLVRAIIKQVGKRATTSLPVGPSFPYRKRQYLLTKAERSFYEVLANAAGSNNLVFAKVRLADLVYVEKGTERWRTYQNSIGQKHLDFVLCSQQDISPRLVIELDDASHNREDRQQPDTLVDNILQAAQLPILRVKARETYNTRELAQQLADTLAPQGTK